MRALFPDIQPNQSGYLAVGDGHEVYYEESGNPQGIPVLVVHGGPGGGTSPLMRRFFDPKLYRIVLFDQRGCGQSRPHAEIQCNTTPHLISDMEQLRDHLNIDQWLLFGGSWGVTLSLAYAIAHPEHVLGMVLRGVFLARPEDLAWLYSGGMAAMNPDGWQRFSEFADGKAGQPLLQHYLNAMTGNDELLEARAAKEWMRYETAAATLLPNPKLSETLKEHSENLPMAKISAHYMVNGCFLDSPLLEHLSVLQDVPCIIVQGRYDLVTPPAQAQLLANAWPAAELRWVPAAGHSSSDDNMRDALLHATEDIFRFIN
ncbi:prolyl aminopeptidase [Salinibius halmophilus]|uniref:prolyl aminopeptidase n=1 Tax=Salinibius halmophilus TaxID=1853216 RepID=UPI000E6617B3|nr:prolyl aminopeptidase [Salinibius halmophilus]